MLCDAQLYLDRSQEELRLTAAVLSPFRQLFRLTGMLRFERKEPQKGSPHVDQMWTGAHLSDPELTRVLGCLSTKWVVESAK